MRLGPTAFAALLLVRFSWGDQADPQAPKNPTVQVPVSTEVVRVDVVVTDKGGRARPGLTREDFVVLEDGKPQPITQFQAFSVPPLASALADPKAEKPDVEDAPDAAEGQPRYVVLAVDDIHIEAANLLRLRKTLDRFLERSVPPEDMVALVTTSGARAQDFTRDRSALRRVVGQLVVEDRRPRQIDVPYIDEYQAERIILEDPEALRVAVEEIRTRRMSPNPEAEARTVARQVVAEAVDTARITLDTVDNVVRGMSGLRGRKVAILVSDGFLTGLQLRGSAGFDLRRITDSGARAGVIVYGLDSRGLQANAPGQSASSRTPMLASTMGPRQQMARASELAIHDAMNALSADTGGFLIAFTNDLSGGLQKIMKDTETYYVLAYEPSNEKRDGAFRKIEVRLPALRDIRIRHRKGYFGPNDRRRDSVARAAVPEEVVHGGSVPETAARAATVKATDERVQSAIRGAVDAPAPLDDLNVRLSADFVSLDAAASQIVVSTHVDLHGVAFASAGGRRVANIDVGGGVFNEAGAEVSGLATERAALDFTDQAYERAIENGLDYQRAALVKPGRYRVSVAVREDASGKIGSATQWVEVPDLAGGKLALSSLFLMKEVASPAGGAPAAAAPVLRGVQAHPVYQRKESLHLNFFAYNQAVDSRSLVTRTEIWRGGEHMAVSRPEALTSSQGGPPVLHSRKIGLSTFEAGDYEVRIVVSDEGNNVVAAQKAAFTIE